MKMGVYGAGRFGAFWADFLAEDNDVIYYSRSSRDCCCRARWAPEEEVLNADLLFFCVSISAFEPVLERVAPLLGPRTAVLDTCSVKVRPVDAMRRILGDSRPYLGIHPMFGPDSARNGAEGLPLVLCPEEGRVDPAFRSLVDLFSGRGLVLRTMTPDQHDREAAYTQGITHFIGRVLQDMGLAESDIATLGFRKLLEIREQTCNDPMQLFQDLQRYNPHTPEMRADLRRSMDRILSQLGGAGLDTEDGPLYDDLQGENRWQKA